MFINDKKDKQSTSLITVLDLPLIVFCYLLFYHKSVGFFRIPVYKAKDGPLFEIMCQ